MSQSVLVQSNVVEETRQLIKIVSIMFKVEAAAFSGVGAALWCLENLPIHNIDIVYWRPDTPEVIAGVYKDLGIATVWEDGNILIVRTASGHAVTIRFSQHSRSIASQCSKVFYTGHRFPNPDGIRVAPWDIMTCSVLTEIAADGPNCLNIAALVDLWENAYGDATKMQATLSHFVRSFGAHKLEQILRGEASSLTDYTATDYHVHLEYLIERLWDMAGFLIMEDIEPRISAKDVEIKIEASLVLEEFGKGDSNESSDSFDAAGELTNAFGDEDML